MRRLKSVINTLFTLALLGYVAFCAYLYFNQEQFIYYPTKLESDHAFAFSVRFEEANLPVDGATINVVRFRADNPKGVILYLHGNGDIIPFLERIAAYFVSLDYDVVIPDYRGYGKSTGQITNEAELHADMEAVYQYVLGLYDEADVTIYGQSLGTGLSVPLAAAHSPKQLFLESPYFSMVNLVRTHLPVVPGFLLKYQLRSDQWIGQVDAPVYVIHGDRDTVIPFEQGVRLFELIKSPREFLHLPGAGHGPHFGDERLRKFLEKKL